ncbi:exodeoxyribonuclease V subunit alpha [Marinobacter sp.]|uniref:exodeoxyribonuclease V subunit alpha n=1 Tax=Marinobacter sp. TaxID=50741 RepID=UPI00384C8903
MNPEQFELGFDSPEPSSASQDPSPGQLPGLQAEDRAIAQGALESAEQLLALLERWVELGWLRSLDAALVRFVDDEARGAGQTAAPLLLLGIALASHQLGRGHVCLDLNIMAREGFNDALSLPPEDETAPDVSLVPSDILRKVTPEDWEAALAQPLLVSDSANAASATNTPLVRDGLRLYLRRYWQYEQAIFRQLTERLERPTALEDPAAPASLALKRALTRLFPGGVSSAEEIDWQRIACANSARWMFSVITGGPGTGKTTTVVRLLAALQSVALETGAPGRALRIRLAAPTGKAAARLSESISGAVAQLDLAGLDHQQAIREAVPTGVTTLHRLLGSIPGSRRFRHHRHNPLVLDALVIDEASMVDIEMMARVLDALPAHARLILLGDKDQLASVDAGAVLGELCQRAAEGWYSEQTRAWVAAVTGDQLSPGLVRPDGTAVDQAITMLRRSYRFAGDSGIGRLAEAVNSGAESAEVRALFRHQYPDIARLSVNTAEPGKAISDHCVEGGAGGFTLPENNRGTGTSAAPAPEGYRAYLEQMKATRPGATAPLEEFDVWARNLLDAYGRFQLLCGLRRGPWGVEGLNVTVAAALQSAGLIRETAGWYAGRPVMVTRNDYSLGLMNGDIGITLELPARHWVQGREVADPARLVQRVAFPSADIRGGVRWVLPSRLQSVETVYAMTVHKSQGSEFSHACLVLPDRLNPVLTRELIYTGITRARHWFSLLLPEASVFDQAISRRVVRTSGLGRALGLSSSRN